ncbi:MAG: hypothetical protein AB1349_03085 [Elusimicrobiota bacterium]
MDKKLFIAGLLKVGLILGMVASGLAEVAELKLNSNDGSTGFVIQDKDSVTVYRTDSDGNTVIKGTMSVEGNAFSVGGSTLVVKAGNVGIGTTNPLSLLHLK